MEEELNENELEEKFYSMLHYVDETQANVTQDHDASKIIENAPRSTLRRYWRTSGDHTVAQNTNPYQKVNIPNQKTITQKEAPAVKNNTDKAKPKEEKQNLPSDNHLPEYLSIFQSPVPHNIKKTIEIIEHDVSGPVVELETSDEDEVIEIALPPKPTITIESSDDEAQPKTACKNKVKTTIVEKANTQEREVSASPVPSVVSSVSDDFIRSDCIALNISSKRPDNHSFDFSLHGAEFLSQSSPAKKKKKKKNKDSTTSTPIIDTTAKPATVDEYFATPKSKAKNKKQKSKSYNVAHNISIPNADIYDSDSNQSIIDKNQLYIVTEKSLPNADVYESDSSETIRNPTTANNDKQKSKNSIDVDNSDSSIDKPVETPNLKRKNSTHEIPEANISIVDLTDKVDDIDENIVIGNVTGFVESEDYGDEHIDTAPPQDVTKFGSTKIPAILYENLDFDNLKGKDKVCKSRRYSLTTLRAEMEKFYNESWGGENFNHREIQKNMSRDKSLWAIDPKDRMPALCRKKHSVICNYCHRPGHRDDTCRMKPPVCYMCGNTGHIEPRCPSKICVNCGSPNYMYSTMCRNCAGWGRLACAECGQRGHPASHCPDMWRRYHNTIDSSTPLEENHYMKKHYQLFCSGCTRRGHLVHTCRISLPFSGLPINSPFVNQYRPVYGPIKDYENSQNTINQRNRQKTFQQDATVSSGTTFTRNDRNKRQSKSPTLHESHINKRRNIFPNETSEVQRNPKSPLSTAHQRKNSQSNANEDNDRNNDSENISSTAVADNKGAEVEKAPDFIPIGSSNRDKKGQIIQDNEVSDTSDVVTSARIYVTNEVMDKLKTKEGEEWLKDTMTKLNVTVQSTDINSFLSIKGKVGDQETFQSALRDWSKPDTERANLENPISDSLQSESENSAATHNIPKNRNNVLRKLSKALESLKEDLGDPEQMYKELNYLQNRHLELLKQKVINPKQLMNSRDHINEMLKKLNMILLGQAGLADGTKHINELHSLQDKLIKYRQKNISAQLRKEIGQHYHCIFTAMPRDDYCELLKLYNVVKSQTIFKKKKKDKSFKINPKKKKKFQPLNSVVPQQPKSLAKDITEMPKKEITQNIERKNSEIRKPLVEKTINKLVFYHRRLINARPNDSVLKKTRVELVRKLHSHIASLHRNANTSSKALKKMRKIQEQAQVFLNNV